MKCKICKIKNEHGHLTYEVIDTVDSREEAEQLKEVFEAMTPGTQYHIYEVDGDENFHTCY